MTPLVPKDTAATPNMFSYLAAHVALSLKNRLVFANCHTGDVLPRPSAMPLIPFNAFYFFIIDSGICGISLRDALCCIPPDVLQFVFKSAHSASGEVHGLDLCEPWPSFLLKNVTNARNAAGTVMMLHESGRGQPTPDLGVATKKLEEWQSSISAALHALQDKHLIDLMASARSESPGLEQREHVQQQFLEICASRCSSVAGVDEVMIQKVCGYILRTLPYFPANVFDQLLWFGQQTPWEEWFQTCISVTVYFLSTTVGTLRNTHRLLRWASYVTPPSITVGSVT
jgi:hypothetical protein